MLLSVCRDRFRYEKKPLQQPFSIPPQDLATTISRVTQPNKLVLIPQDQKKSSPPPQP